MHYFSYINDHLHCEAFSVGDIAVAVGTPFYLYSYATLKRHLTLFQKAFSGVDTLVCYSAKANTNHALLTLFRQWGSGLDVVSGGELHRGVAAGFDPGKIVYSGVGKRVDEIDAAISCGIMMFNIESMDELSLINARAGQLKRKAPVALRINPDVDPKTHPYISTGLKKNKFGIDMSGAVEGYRQAQRLPHVEVKGIDCHIGSQITTLEPFQQAMESVTLLIRELHAQKIDIHYIDMGGGLGITYQEEAPPHLDAYARRMVAAFKGTGFKLILEPGRVIVGNAGILVTQVLYIKKNPDKAFVIVDAGMNDLMRPSLYQAFHAIQPVVRNQRESMVVDVVGPICESGDFLAQDRSMRLVHPQELLAVMSAGAYGYSMSSNYCSRPRVAEVLVRGDQFDVIRRRENYTDLMRGEQLPDFLEEEGGNS
jgi:diaminopimelate decarboxylase